MIKFLNFFLFYKEKIKRNLRISKKIIIKKKKK